MPRRSVRLLVSTVVFSVSIILSVGVTAVEKVDAAGNVVGGAKKKTPPKRKSVKRAATPEKKTRPEGWKEKIAAEEGDAVFKVHTQMSGKKLSPRLRAWVETRKIPVATYRAELYIEKPPRVRGGRPIRVLVCRRDLPLWSPGDRGSLFLIRTSDPGCEAFSFKDQTNFILTVTPLDERNRKISLRKLKNDLRKSEAIVGWNNRPQYVLYSAGTYAGVFGLGVSGQDARSLSSGLQPAIGVYSRAKWTYLNLGVGVDMAPLISYTNATTGLSQSVPWVRIDVGGGWEFDFIRSEALTLIFHAEGWLDYTIHNPSVFPTNFSSQLSIFNVGAYGGATLNIWNYEFKGMAGFLFGPQSVAKGPALRIDVKSDYYFEKLRFVGLARARWINWSVASTGVNGNNLEVSVGVGAEWYFNY